MPRAPTAITASVMPSAAAPVAARLGRLPLQSSVLESTVGWAHRVWVLPSTVTSTVFDVSSPSPSVVPSVSPLPNGSVSVCPNRVLYVGEHFVKPVEIGVAEVGVERVLVG